MEKRFFLNYRYHEGENIVGAKIVIYKKSSRSGWTMQFRSKLFSSMSAHLEALDAH